MCFCGEMGLLKMALCCVIIVFVKCQFFFVQMLFEYKRVTLH